MADAPHWKIVPSDIEILRELAKRQIEIAQEPRNEELRRLWRKHNSLQGERPMVLLESGGVRNEFLPDTCLKCIEDWARGLERGFRGAIYHAENVKDDSVVDPYLRCNWHVNVSNYGLDVEYKRADGGKGLGYRWEHPIKDLDKDFPKLRPRTYSVDRERTMAWKAHLEQVFHGIMPVRIRGSFYWTMGMTMTAIHLIGLEYLMLYMVDNPEGLHRLMAFLRDDHIAYADWLEKEGLYTLNNDNDYTGSGSRGFTEELPQKDWKDGDKVRQKDLWVLSESQETVGVSPRMFAEFVFPYQNEVVRKFGLCYYGCCEPVHSRWDSLKKLPNLRSVSVSPWCDQEFMGEALGKRYVFSRKPPPALISTQVFDEGAIREDIRRTLRAAKGCSVELAMKDVHTVNNEPRRMARWVEIAREAIGDGA